MSNVLSYFEDIMQIPRESGKEEKIADYLVNYAKENNIEYSLGRYNTVFLKKNNNSDKTIILQAHSDMVCVSTDDYDFDNKGIPFYIDGDYYKSKNTSLGADDGIGLAIILAILQENENMPNIEVMITTQEETTMLGASNFNYSLFSGKTLISLDGIKEADIESSSAGMCSLTLNKIINYEVENSNTYKLSISGLKGGHSGDDIDKNRCNAIKLAIKLLNVLDYKEIADIQFGKRDNVIPSEGYAVFSSNKDLELLQKKLNDIELELNEDDSGIILSLEKIDFSRFIKESKDIVEFISKIKDGLLETYQNDGFPLLSANIGKISVLNDILEIKYSIRSSDLEKEKMLLEEIESLANQFGFEMIVDAKKPFFPFKEDSMIRTLLAETYKKLYGKETIVKKVHACMEGGILSNNIENLDICTIAPTIDNCHSINECVSISSTERVYNWLRETLIRYNEMS